VAKAIAWVKRNIQTYGGDPGSLVVMGHSAGAQMAALVCTDERFLKAEGLALRDLRNLARITWTFAVFVANG
jgi:acetyl esterase/lipase